IWMEAVRMVKKSPQLLRLIKPRVAEMRSEFNDSMFAPLGNDSDTLHGLNVHGALMDELHAWKDTNLYDVIVDGISARTQPMILVTTTAGTVRDGIFDIKYEEIERVIDSYTGECINDRILPLIYELDARSEWTQPDCWIKANPGLGTIKSAEVLADKVKAAQLDSLKVKNLVCKDFNIRETGATAYMTYEEILNTQVFDINTMRPRYAIGGADLSETTDLTAAVVLFRMPGDWRLYIRAMFWMPEDLLEIRVKEDKVPYDIWKQQGLLRTTPGNKLHPKYVTQWFMEISEEMDTYITWIGYDAWAAAYWVEDMQASFGPNAMEAVRQGKQTLSIPLKELKADLSAKRVIYQNHPILKWCLSNMNVESDKNGNIQPCKGKNPRARIDGAAALLNAYVIYKKHEEEYLSDVNVENEGA
ncbi:MAG: terminase large subunit, partial [Acidaminococcaceae bacterium]|nr:terminase large subunit [Acidaminococcaceae bacterium]